MRQRQLYLGIDLGTTNSKAAFLDYRDGGAARPQSLRVKQHEELSQVVSWENLPSVVMFGSDRKSVYVGEYARRYLTAFPERTVRSIKRLMGKNWQYAVPDWGVWSPEAISALILKHIRQQALERLVDMHGDLSSVAISVPASFGSQQRQATLEASKLAGFTGDVSLIDEPSAALIHYLFDQWQKGNDFDRDQRILVFDMGGGTLDVSLALIEPTKKGFRLKILARSRYTELAGTEFDLRLAAYLTWRLQNEGLQIPDSPQEQKSFFRAVLFDLAEPLKLAMSREMNRYYRWAYMVDEEDAFDSDLYRVSHTIAPRNRLVGNLELPDLEVRYQDFQATLEPFFVPVDEVENPEGIGTIFGPIHTTLADANLTPEDVDLVLMHGGMCQLPMIQAALTNYFPPQTLVKTSPNPMTSVAQGAALYLASREGRLKEIELEEPALFESIFIEHETGFSLAVDKNERVGQSNTLALSFNEPVRRVSLSFYNGFSESDPLLSFDHAAYLELPGDVTALAKLRLRWEIQPNRTVTWSWQIPPNGDWKALQLTTKHRDSRVMSQLRSSETIQTVTAIETL